MKLTWGISRISPPKKTNKKRLNISRLQLDIEQDLKIFEFISGMTEVEVASEILKFGA